MKLRCPIPRQYRGYGKKCYITQLYGANKNKLFYGPEGHKGVDLKTTGGYKYKQINTWDWTDFPDFPKIEDGEHGFERVERDRYESQGRIPLLAAMDGDIKYYLNENKQKDGWGLTITNGDWRCLYWHIETPWDSVENFDGTIVEVTTDHKAKAGEQIAIGGNNGKSTGPHLHFELEKKTENGWEEVDPLPYFDDIDVIYETYYGPMSRNDGEAYYRGEKTSEEKAKQIFNNLPSVKL